MDSAVQQTLRYLPLKALKEGGPSHLAPTSTLLPRHVTTSLSVIPAERAGLLRPASESRNPVIKIRCCLTPAVDYWVPARASPVEPGSLGRDDSPYAAGGVSA
jgi:hypothetical protein